MGFSSRKMTMVAALVVVVVAISSWTPANAQNTAGDLPCVQSLIPCLDYINATKPPPACCLPLKEAFKTQVKCLCTIFNNPDITAASGNVNVTQALELPKNCGVKADTSVCKNVAQAPASGPATSASTGSTPGTSGGSKVGPVSGLVMLLVGLMLIY